MTDAFAWVPPIQRCEFAFLAEALGLPEDFSRPAHTGALRTTLHEAGLAYRVELDEEGTLIARITSGHDIIGLAEVGDFDDALEAGCRALALALLDAYEKHVLILPTADPYPMGQTPLQLVLADEPVLRKAAGPIAETFHYPDPYEWADARTRNALLAVGYMLGIRADLSKYYNIDLVEGVLEALHLSYVVDWEAHRTAAVVITYHDMDGKHEVAGFATATADHRDDAEICAIALALLMAARNGHVWRPAGRKDPDIFIYDWEREIEPFGLAHYAIWHMFRHGGHVELDPYEVEEVHHAFTLLWELTVTRMWPSEFLDAGGNPTLQRLRTLVDDYAQYPGLPKRTLEQIAMLALDLRFEIMLGKEGTQEIKAMLRLEEQLKQDAQIIDLFAKAKGALVDPAVWLDEGNETAQIISAAEMHVTAQQNGYLVLRRAHPRTVHEAQHMWWRWCASEGDPCIVVRVLDDDRAELRVKLPPTLLSRRRQTRVREVYLTLRMRRTSENIVDRGSFPEAKVTGFSNFSKQHRERLKAAFARRSFNYHIGKREAYVSGLSLADAEELAVEVVKAFRRSHRPKMKRTIDAMLGTD